MFDPYHLALLGIPQNDLQYLIDRCGMRIKEGRLLEPRTNEIMLSEEVARALGLHLGDQIDQSIDPEIYPDILTPMVLVGILEDDPATGSGPNARVGLASYEYFDSHELYAPQTVNGVLVIAKEGRKQSVNDFLETDIASPRTVVGTYERRYRLYTQDRQGILFAFGFINSAVAIGAAILVGVVNQIAITQRLPELGMLNALGHHKKRLVRRLALETASVSGLSWTAGLVLAFIVLAWMKSGLYYDRGMELDLLNLTPLWFVVPIPLTVIVLSTIGIVRVFARFDAVAIVERDKLSLEAQNRKRVPRSPSRLGAISAFTFYLRHRRQGVTLLVSTTLAILVVTMAVFVSTATVEAMKPDLEYLQYVSKVWPSRDHIVDAGVMGQIRSHPAVERVVPATSTALEIDIPLNDNVATNVYGILEDDLPYLLDLFGMQVQQGRLPRAQSNEIVIAETAALNHGLRVGDTIDLPYYIISEFHQFISSGNPVEMAIVGILERRTERSGAGQTSLDDMWLSFASYEFLANHESTRSQAVHWLVVPAEGRKAEVDTWLEQNVDSRQIHVTTYATDYSKIENKMREPIFIFAATEIVIAVIVTIAVAVLNYISFTQRREEFGILNALGRSRLWLVLRTARETGSIVAIAWLISAAIYGTSLVYTQAAVYAPKGISLDLFTPIPWLFSFPVPLVAVATSVGVVGWMFSRLDPVSIVERR